jgi:hypothetical protein
LLGELVERIDEALRMARSSEAAVSEVGEAAIDAAERARAAVVEANRAAEQAQRAATLAERASESMLEGRRGGIAPGPPADASLRRFAVRADRVAARLEALERLPV